MSPNRLWPFKRTKKDPKESQTGVSGYNGSVPLEPAAPTATAAPICSGLPAQIPAKCQAKDVADAPVALQTRLHTSNYDLWAEALESLDETDKHNVTATLTDDEDHSLADRKGLAVHIQDRIDTASKNLKHDSRTRRIIENSASVLRKFASAGDVISSFDPAHAALPWAAVRSIIVIVIAHDELNSNILTAFAQVTSLLAQCDIYQQLYMDSDPGVNASVVAWKKLRSCMVQSYFTTQIFLSYARKCQNSRFNMIAAPFRVEVARGHVNKLLESERQLVKAAEECEKLCSSSNRANVRALLNLMEIVQDQIKSALAKRMDTLDRISSLKFGDHHNLVKENRTANTCEWLLSDDSFHEWESSDLSGIMWLRGYAGAGKTYLTSKVIDHMRSLYENTTVQEGFAFFYCNRNETGRGEYGTILRSYVRQLATPYGDASDLRDSLVQCCLEASRNCSTLDIGSCENQILESINHYHKTTIVIDALDECDIKSRGQLVRTLKLLMCEAERPLKIFISGRPDPDIKECFHSLPCIEIDATKNQGDIEKFIKEEIQSHIRWKRMSKPLKAEIVKKLQEGSRGMFQWANLQIQQLLELTMEQAIKNRLGKLPDSLKGAYNEIYDKATRDPLQKIVVDRACAWVVCACVPLKTDELIGAVSVDPDNIPPFALHGAIDEDLLLQLCNNLLVLDSQQQVWRFSHLSVAEYFEEKHTDFLLQAHCSAAKVCLRLLLETYKITTDDRVPENFGDKQGPTQIDLFDRKHQFQRYVFSFWGNHTRTYDTQTVKNGSHVDPKLKELLVTFLGSPENSSPSYRDWFGRISYYWKHPESSILYDIKAKRFAPAEVTIFLICRFSLFALLKDWWDDENLPILARNDQGSDLLTLSAFAGYNPLCEALVKKGGTELKRLSCGYGNALSAAISEGYTETVKLLLMHGAEVDHILPDRHFGSALITAAKYGNIEYIKLLIKHGANVNLFSPNGLYGSALIAAVENGNTEHIEFLIKHGADVNLLLPSGLFGSALAAGTRNGNMDNIKLLLNHGADANAVLPGGYGSALAAAASHRLTGAMKLFLQSGAEPNVILSDEVSGSALAAAVGFGPKENVELLLDHGAEANLLLTYGLYGHALAVAAHSDDVEMVGLLLNHGADANVVLSAGQYGSPLAAAATTVNNIETIKLLLDSGAEANMLLSCGIFGSALAGASWLGMIDYVGLLLDNGAEPDLLLTCGRFGSALAAASETGRTIVVKHLIEKGADVNLLLSCGSYGTALAAASKGGKKETVQELLKNGAEVNLVLAVGKYGSALGAASMYGQQEAMKVLIENGAEVDLLFSSGFYGSALAAASHMGHIAAVQILLENGADTNLQLENGPHRTALEASRAIISAERVQEVFGWPAEASERRRQKRDKATIEELLQRYGATE